MFRFRGGPVFILGNPRAGTRMVATILDAHQEIVVSDEFKAFESLAELIERVGEEQGRKLARWDSDKAFAAAQFLIDASSDAIAKKSHRARYFVNKTPSAIFRLPQIESIWSIHNPRFVYCIRHPMSILRSLESVHWNKNGIKKNLERLVRSVKVFNKLRENREVLVAQVDKLTGPGDRKIFGESLFTFSGIEMDEAAREFLERDYGPVNTASRHSRDGGLVELTDRQIRYIRKHRGYNSVCDQFGYAP